MIASDRTIITLGACGSPGSSFASSARMVSQPALARRRRWRSEVLSAHTWTSEALSLPMIHAKGALPAGYCGIQFRQFSRWEAP